ncbi:MAG TPA: nodulation protein NfeD [Ignavibacteria bacterium]|nr:nodulation protein NfeD [Ignavibacteria bacterium]
MRRSILLFLILLFTSALYGQAKKVYYGDIEGDIDLGLAPYVKRIVATANSTGADAIIFRINTFGGRVDAATQIKDAILNSQVKTIAFIDKRAISAGSLIALSCEIIVMVPGGAMGATTVVDQTGTKQAEKAQSYMRSEMRATAERTGRRTDVAEAMVDERVVIPGLVDSTQLLTLTSKEALQYGMADTLLATLEEVLEAYNLKDAEIIMEGTNWGEDVVRFLSHPIVSSILIMVAMLGMFTEIKTPGWGLPGTAALVALTLFFGSGLILELVSWLEILIFAAGIILILVEIFFVPGFGVFGILGIVAVVTSLFLGLLSDFQIVTWSMISRALIQLAGAFVATFVAAFFLSKVLPKTSFFNRLILKDNILIRSGYTTEPEALELVGKTGEAITDLRPSGTALIDNKRIDVVTEGDYLIRGTKIEVIKESGSKIVVREVK